MDYISRDDALDFEAEIELDDPDEIEAVMKGMMLYQQHIKSLPLADVERVVRGKWIEEEWETFEGRKRKRYRCSNCLEVQRVRDFYCSNCGADMRGDKSK